MKNAIQLLFLSMVFMASSCTHQSEVVEYQPFPVPEEKVGVVLVNHSSAPLTVFLPTKEKKVLRPYARFGLYLEEGDQLFYSYLGEKHVFYSAHLMSDSEEIDVALCIQESKSKFIETHRAEPSIGSL